MNNSKYMAFGHHYNRHVERTITDEFAFFGKKKKKIPFKTNSFRRKINTRFKTGIEENRTNERKDRKSSNTWDEEIFT